MRGTLEAGESCWTEAEKDILIECARELDVNEDQEVLTPIAIEGGNNQRWASYLQKVTSIDLAR